VNSEWKHDGTKPIIRDSVGSINNVLNVGGIRIPVSLVWPHGGTNVSVIGSFTNWQAEWKLQKTNFPLTDDEGGTVDENYFYLQTKLRPGIYAYKFIVDGEWKYDGEQPTEVDSEGNVNNALEVSTSRQFLHQWNTPTFKSHYFLYLPDDYFQTKCWPVIFFFSWG